MPARAALALLALLVAGLPPGAAGIDELQPRGSILVVGDGGFRELLSGVRGGAGTPDDPYVISGWTIVHTNLYGIRLVDTRAHVVIENVRILGREAEATGAVGSLDCATRLRDPTLTCEVGSRGIELERAQNVTVRDVVIWSERTIGVWAHASSHVLIERTVVGPESSTPVLSSGYGFIVVGGENVTMRDVTTRKTFRAFLLTDTRDTRIEDSRFLRGAWNAQASSTEGLTIEGSTFTGGGILLAGDMARLRVAHSEFLGAAEGIDGSLLASATDVQVCGSRFEGVASTQAAALHLERARDVHIHGNHFANNTYGAAIVLSQDVRLERNHFADADEWGASLSTRGLEVHENLFETSARGVTIGDEGNATGNWWGAASGPSGDGMPGSGATLVRWQPDIAFEPWLTSPPAFSLAC